MMPATNHPPTRRLLAHQESFPIRGAFRIARGSKTMAEVVVAEVWEEGMVGRGECVPYARYGESVEGVLAALEAMVGPVARGLNRAALRSSMPAGAARNALDCALWDLEAKRRGVPAWVLAALPEEPVPLTTCFTLSLESPSSMADAARKAVAQRHSLLKMKLTGDGDLPRVQAVRQASPEARLIVDANEGWTLDHLAQYGPAFAALGVELIEQPLPADKDEALRGFSCPVPLGADESCHSLDSLERLKGLYQVVNIKLDKTGGLTEALLMKAAADAAGFQVMVGCMVATSRAMAPAMLVGQGAAFVDLDGPLLLAEDRTPGLRYDGALVYPPEPAVWG